MCEKEKSGSECMYDVRESLPQNEYGRVSESIRPARLNMYQSNW